MNLVRDAVQEATIQVHLASSPDISPCNMENVGVNNKLQEGQFTTYIDTYQFTVSIDRGGNLILSLYYNML